MFLYKKNLLWYNVIYSFLTAVDPSYVNTFWPYSICLFLCILHPMRIRAEFTVTGSDLWEEKKLDPDPTYKRKSNPDPTLE